MKRFCSSWLQEVLRMFRLSWYVFHSLVWSVISCVMWAVLWLGLEDVLYTSFHTVWSISMPFARRRCKYPILWGKEIKHLSSRLNLDTSFPSGRADGLKLLEENGKEEKMEGGCACRTGEEKTIAGGRMCSCHESVWVRERERKCERLN